MTLGEKRIQVIFNASGSSSVDKIKRMAAMLIDEIDDTIPNPVDPDKARWKSMALTAIEEGCGWAVKALTAETENKPRNESNY